MVKEGKWLKKEGGQTVFPCWDHSCLKKECRRLERWLSGLEPWLLFWRSWVQIPATTWWVVHNHPQWDLVLSSSVSYNCYMLFHAGKDLCLGKRKRLAAFLTLSIVVLYPKDFGCGLPFYSQRAVWEPCTDRKGNHVKQNQKKNNKTKQSSHFIIQRLIAYKEK